MRSFTDSERLTSTYFLDIVAIAGDLVDGTMEDLSNAVRPLQNLKSTYGVYFSTGIWWYSGFIIFYFI